MIFLNFSLDIFSNIYPPAAAFFKAFRKNTFLFYHNTPEIVKSFFTIP